MGSRARLCESKPRLIMRGFFLEAALESYKSNLHDHPADVTRTGEALGLARKMDVDSHHHSILPGEDHDPSCSGLDFQDLMVGSWVDRGRRRLLGVSMVGSQGKGGCGGCQC